MNEFEKLYTIEDVAKMTSLTSRTIRNYLKNRVLEGRKIGGQWRFTRKDIEKFFDNGNVTNDIKHIQKQEVIDFINGVNTDLSGQIQICTIVDFYCDKKETAKEISDNIMSTIKNVGEKYSYEYIEKEAKARFTLLGNPSFIINTLKILDK